MSLNYKLVCLCLVSPLYLQIHLYVYLGRYRNLTFDPINICRDPKLRPTFAEIMAALKPLQKPINSPQVPRPSASRIQPPRVGEEPTD